MLGQDIEYTKWLYESKLGKKTQTGKKYNFLEALGQKPTDYQVTGTNFQPSSIYYYMQYQACAEKLHNIARTWKKNRDEKENDIENPDEKERTFPDFF